MHLNVVMWFRLRLV